MSAPDRPTGSGADAPGGGTSGTDPPVASAIEALAQPGLAPAQRRRLVGKLAGHARQAVPRWRPSAAVRWMVDTVGELAPHVPIRDPDTLYIHYGGLSGDALAQRLVRNAARATAGVGAASGGLAAVKWTVPPTLLGAPVLLAAETVAVVAIEVKLVGELHAAYQLPVPGTSTERAVSLLQSWTQQRGIQPMLPGTGLPGAGAAAVLGTATRNQLADRLARRFSGNLPTLAPLLTGAVVAAYLNQRATRTLARQLRADLR